MIDVVIATFNRINSAIRLANAILQASSKELNNIILSDSSDHNEPGSFSEGKIIHVVTKHHNQPYQRYLGYCLSKADYIIFLDDDMEITETDGLFERINDIFRQESIAAIAFNFSEKHHHTTLSKIPATALKNRNNFLKRIKNIITGYPMPGSGRYGLCGTRGVNPDDEGYTEIISGGAFAVRRDVLYKNFNFQLFDIYENGLGKGEDGILGYTLSKRGRIIFNKDPFFIHNDQNDSTYSTDVYQFARRVAFSRLYLSLEKTRLDNGTLFFARLHYHYYMFWRVMGLLINYMFDSSEKRKKMLLGTLDGWKLTFGFKFDKNLTVNKYWHNEAMKDLTQNGISN